MSEFIMMASGTCNLQGSHSSSGGDPKTGQLLDVIAAVACNFCNAPDRCI